MFTTFISTMYTVLWGAYVARWTAWSLLVSRPSQVSPRLPGLLLCSHISLVSLLPSSSCLFLLWTRLSYRHRICMRIIKYYQSRCFKLFSMNPISTLYGSSLQIMSCLAMGISQGGVGDQCPAASSLT